MKKGRGGAGGRRGREGTARRRGGKEGERERDGRENVGHYHCLAQSYAIVLDNPVDESYGSPIMKNFSSK